MEVRVLCWLVLYLLEICDCLSNTTLPLQNITNPVVKFEFLIFLLMDDSSQVSGHEKGHSITLVLCEPSSFSCSSRFPGNLSWSIIERTNSFASMTDLCQSPFHDNQLWPCLPSTLAVFPEAPSRVNILPRVFLQWQTHSSRHWRANGCGHIFLQSQLPLL